ncbi:MAG: 5'-nucleotidase C-terminal domain-containing protein [Lachnospiraceae bacterium]|nr:5'-nucleotidase C-terminal domain-containing protein [Lachnospiraceae bacterium]
MKERIKEKRRTGISIIICIITLMSAALAGCQLYYPPEAGTGEYRLPIIETSDIHGALIEGVEPDYRYKVAYIADKIKDIRSTEHGEDTDRLVLLDGGDIYQGNAISLLSEGEAMSAVFDELHYDAVALGNHEFDWGVEKVVDDNNTMRDYEINGKLCRNNIPVVCSNLYRDGEKADITDDYVILSKKATGENGRQKRVRIGVIGFAEEYSTSISAKSFTNLGYTIVTDYDEVNRISGELKDNKGCDAVILLAHGAPDVIAERLGSKSSVDLVLGGHIHKDIIGTTEWGLRYLSPYGNAGAYVYDELVFENDGKGGLRIKSGADDNAELFSTTEDRDMLLDNPENEEELDHDIIDLSQEYLDRVRPYLETEIGYITEPATADYIEGSNERASTVGNFVCDAMRRSVDADVAFINRSGIRYSLYIDDVDRRTVTKLDLFSMLPFDDRLYVYEITYGELLDVFDYSMNGRGRSVLTYMSGIDCYFRDDPEDDGSGEYPDTMVDALVKDGVTVYHDGEWKDGWENEKLKLVVIDYSAEAEDNNNGTENPLRRYNETDRLISKEGYLRECVIETLEDEAAANDGHLHVDTEPHFIYGAYGSNDDQEDIK